MTKKVLPKEASEFTKKVNEKVKKSLPFENTKDFDDAKKGFIGTWDHVKVDTEDGHAVWDLEEKHLILLTQVCGVSLSLI